MFIILDALNFHNHDPSCGSVFIHFQYAQVLWKTLLRFFMLITLNLKINLGCTDIFTIFSFSIYEDRTNFSSFLRSCLMFCNKMFDNFLLNNFQFFWIYSWEFQHPYILLFFLLRLNCSKRISYNWLLLIHRKAIEFCILVTSKF